MKNGRLIKYFAGIFLAVVLLRLPLFWTGVMDVDEAIYSLFTKVWFAGGVPYIDCVETKPLGVYFIYGVIFRLFGDFNILAVHIVTVLWVFATCWVIYEITKYFSTERAGLLAALFYAVFTTTYTPKVIASVIEPFMLLPLCLMFLALLKRRVLLAGLFFSACCLLKYTAGIYIFAVAAFLFMDTYASCSDHDVKHGPINRAIKIFCNLALFLLGALPLPAIMLAYLFHKGALDAFVFWTIRGSMDYVAGGADSISLISQTLKRGLPFVAGTLVLWVFVLARTKKIFSRSGGLQPNEWLVWFWLFLSFAPVLAGKRLYGHYFLMLVPPLSVIAAVQFDVWWSACASRFLKRLCVGFIILAGLGCLVPRFFLDQVYKMTGEDNPNDHVTVAEYIKAHTAPEDRVLVWGFAPLVYFYSERMPASRFFWSDLMAGRVPASKQKNGLALQGTKMNRLAWEMFFEDAKRGRPVYFIDTSPAGLHDYENFPIKDYPELSGYLRGNFAQEATVNGAVIYRSNGIIP